MLKTLITSNIEAFSESIDQTKQNKKGGALKIQLKGSSGGNLRTRPETRSSTPSFPTPQISMEHARPDQLERQVKRFLELVIHPGRSNTGVKRLGQRSVGVVLVQETEPSKERKSTPHILLGKTTKKKLKTSPSDIQEPPNYIGHDLILLLQRLQRGRLLILLLILFTPG